MATQTIHDRADGSTQPRQSAPSLIPPSDLPAFLTCLAITAGFGVFAVFPGHVAAFLRFVADFLTGGAL